MIPPFTSQGVLPPIYPGQDDRSDKRSPYITTMLTFCERFGYTAKRRLILLGFLELRDILRAAGLTSGFHWINGSFVEEKDSPNDIDVVTFTTLGDAKRQELLWTLYPDLFNPSSVEKFYVDHQLLGNDRALDQRYARRLGYWYSMWSHQRATRAWKGFISLP